LDDLSAALWEFRLRIGRAAPRAARLDRGGHSRDDGALPLGNALVWTAARDNASGHGDHWPDLVRPAWSVATMLRDWAAAWAAARHDQPPRPSPDDEQADPLRIWLRLRLRWAADHPVESAWDDFTADLRDTRDRMRAELGWTAAPTRRDCPCPECGRTRPENWPGTDSWSCPGCGAEWPDRAGLHAADRTALTMAADAADLGPHEWMPWHLIRQVFPSLTNNTLHHWVGRKIIRTRRRGGTILFHRGDVADRLRPGPDEDAGTTGPLRQDSPTAA
jgi:ribosomal protein L37AE/L43A